MPRSKSDYILLHTLLGTGNPERLAEGCALHSAAPERRRRMEHLRRRPVEYQRFGEVPISG